MKESGGMKGRTGRFLRVFLPNYNGIICGCIGGDGCPARLFANESGYMELLVGENE